MKPVSPCSFHPKDAVLRFPAGLLTHVLLPPSRHGLFYDSGLEMATLADVYSSGYCSRFSRDSLLIRPADDAGPEPKTVIKICHLVCHPDIFIAEFSIFMIMKGIGFVAALCMVLVFSAGCRKKRTCECVTTNNSSGTQVTTQSEFETNKKNAEQLCKDMNKDEGDFTTDCELK